ncbi:CDP-diacylglycerol--glycerol-3-phosphate 3-phosphatidyltransferase [Polystyrenella longa]|uniref:CDP-diacylglycerol--glycerol-3-phosphate 3-phosphatidyltransferase n=1 Tax=Polystyrenella longa TaxID=2528007 RepID=A0A518CNP8_9PLAN|nr:CDP-diacylglycerol--glycerol-3-phosphate 3-phosphatidyltransferase [Polystyrenella longa]QDU80814.1 CDP-diacylglycerol--glycerol-3-phosphate 3-phosphatidyltransferase [Polystyrenella longa]
MNAESTQKEPQQSLQSQRVVCNIPNAITLSRLLLACVLFLLIDIQGFWITSAVLFVFAASTDFLDGYIARKYGMVTILGRIMDPFVDKIIVGGAFLFLLGEPDRSGVNAWMVLIVIGREMFISSLRGFLEKQGQDFSAAWSGKVKMTLQCVAVTCSLLSLSPDYFFNDSWFLLCRDILLWMAIAITLYSGIEYIIRASHLWSSTDD